MSDPYETLASTASDAHAMLMRVAGEGSVVEQIANREWDHQLTREQAVDATGLVDAMAEHVRDTRERLGGLQLGMEEPYSSTPGLLPLNRKERYYTGTVLPMLTASDGFAHLDRLLRLCGLDIDIQAGRGGTQDFQFLTEYGFAESIFTDLDKAKWPDPVAADTPDVVIAGPDWLVAIEAKMFHNPTAAHLNYQMDRQKALIDVWRRVLPFDDAQVVHVLLLPSRLAVRERGQLRYSVVTWEEVLDEYAVVGPSYWARMLREALTRHEELESPPTTFRKNADDLLTGAEIVEAYAAGTLDFDHVGRQDGLKGRFKEDIATGTWRTTKYEVRTGALPGNRNWFTLTEFIAAVNAAAP